MHQALPVLGREIDVLNDGVVRIGGIEFTVGAGEDMFIRTRGAEGLAAEGRFDAQDLQIGDARLGWGAEQRRRRQRRDEAGFPPHTFPP